MKKLTALFLAMFISMGVVFATHQGGFTDTNTPIKTTIKEALKMKDDSYVTLQGNIVKRLSDEKYSFKDSSGTITIEIDDDKWMGLKANTNDILEITGEIEKEFNKIEVDVDTVKKIK